MATTIDNRAKNQIKSHIESQPEQTELATRLGELARPGKLLVSFGQPIPAINPLDFFANGRRLTGTAFYWARPADGFFMVGAGTAITLRGIGPNRFEQIATTWRELAQDYATITEPGVGPSLMGGFAFDPSQTNHNPLWREFGDGAMTLPQFQLTQTLSGHYLTCNLVLPENFWRLPKQQRSFLFEHYAENIARLQTMLLRPYTQPFTDTAVSNQAEYQDVLPAEQWQAIVKKATEEIKRLKFQKTVLAREVIATFEQPLDLVPTLQGLQNAFPTAFIFAVAHHNKCFLGATPERLVELRNQRVLTTALAGSAPRSQQSEKDARIGQELLNSPKNQGEHAIVVQMLAEKLAPLCQTLNVPSEPRLLKLANVQHLYTPIEGQLRGEAGLLDLVANLHPTPALGGYPRKEALDFIRDNEQMDRGWYAAPVGWLDARNEGEFAVAIRSALIDHNQAHLFAGCGIVADSDPASEYQESRIKLRAVANNLVANSRQLIANK